ncbi:alpha/beta hydrolase, partial [Streptomyces violaceoruber]
MTDDATAPSSSCDQNPVPGLPLYDLAGFTHRWVDAEGIR